MSSVKTRKLDMSTILSVVKAQSLSGSLDANASTVTIKDTSSTSGTLYPTLVSDTSGELPIRTDNRLTYNPSTNTLSCTIFDGDLSGNITVTRASNVAITDTSSVSGIFYPTFVSATSGDLPIRTDSNSLTYNPSTNTLSCTTFAGNVSGNATSASNTLTTRDFTDAVRYINFKSDTSGNFPDLVDTDLTYNPFSNNLGIGTNTPAYNLDVSGTANITGNLSVDTNTLFVDASNNRVGIGTNGPQATLSIGGATGQLNHYVYNTTTTSPFNTWFRVAQFANFTERTDINLSISTRAGGAIGLTKVNITSTGTIKADWRNGNNAYGLQGVRLAAQSGITYLEVLTNLVDISGWTITTSYITGSNFTPLEFTSTTGSVPSNTFLFANYGDVNGGSFVSTLSNYNYNILTDSIERMRVTSTGNVGIGKTNPQTTLDISGNLLVSSNVLGQNAPLFVDVSNNRVGIAMRAQNPAAPLHVQSDNNNSTQVIISGGGSHAHTNRGLRIATYQTSSDDAGVNFDAQFPSGELTFSTAGNRRMTVRNNGNVGIGTTTPDNTLHVRGITRISNDDVSSMFYVNWANSTGNTATIMNALINGGAGYGELQSRGLIQTFYTGTATGTPPNIITERMRITDIGNVGINTPAPITKLDISGSGTANEDVLRVNNQGNFASRIWLRNSGRSAYFSMGGTATADSIATGTLLGSLSMGQTAAGAVQFFNGSTPSVKMTILDNGNVGIGTNAPAYQLQLSSDSAAKLTTNTWATTSDQRVKTNIENADLDRCNEIVENLSLKRFQWSEKYFPTVDDRNSIGFIAQEVEQYFPNAVKTYKNKFLLQKGETEEENIYEEIEDFKSLDIDQLIKCLFGSVKYLQNQVKTLVQKNETLEQRIAKLE